jgi:hypothetical protein
MVGGNTTHDHSVKKTRHDETNGNIFQNKKCEPNASDMTALIFLSQRLSVHSCRGLGRIILPKDRKGSDKAAASSSLQIAHGEPKFEEKKIQFQIAVAAAWRPHCLPSL